MPNPLKYGRVGGQVPSTPTAQPAASDSVYGDTSGARNPQTGLRPWETAAPKVPGYTGPEKKPAGLFGKYAQVVSGVMDAYRNLPIIKQAGQLGGLAFGAIAGTANAAVEAAGTPIANAISRYKTGKAETFGQRGESIKTAFKKGYEWGEPMGRTAVADAPVGIMGGKIPMAILSSGTLAQGVEDIQQGHPYAGALEIVLGGLGMKGAVKTKGLLVNADNWGKLTNAGKYAYNKYIGPITPTGGTAGPPGMMQKAAGNLSNVSPGRYKRLEDPEMAMRTKQELDVMGQADDMGANRSSDIGKTVYDQAKVEKQVAFDQWKAQEAAILKNIDSKNIPDAHINAKASADKILNSKYGIITEGRVDPKTKQSIPGLGYGETRFARSSEARGLIEDAYATIKDPVASVEGMLEKQRAMSVIMQRARNSKLGDVKLLVGELKGVLDDQVDALTGGKSTELATSYAKSMGPVTAVMEKMEVKNPKGIKVFDTNKARSFIEQAAQERSTTARDALDALDEVTQGKFGFAKQAEAYGLAKEISRFDPKTSGRVLDYAKAQVATKGGLVSATVGGFFSPYTWGHYFLNKGLSKSAAYDAGKLAAENMKGIYINYLVKAIQPYLAGGNLTKGE